MGETTRYAAKLPDTCRAFTREEQATWKRDHLGYSEPGCPAKPCLYCTEMFRKDARYDGVCDIDDQTWKRILSYRRRVHTRQTNAPQRLPQTLHDAT